MAVRIVVDQLIAGPASAITPAIWNLIRGNKAELIALAQLYVDLRDLAPVALRFGSLVTCDGCRQFEE